MTGTPEPPAPPDPPALTGQIQRRISDISADDWQRCAGRDHPFTQYGFFSALEDSGSIGKGTGWDTHILSLTPEDAPKGAAGTAGTAAPLAIVPLFVKSHSYGEYVFDHSWAHAFERAGGQYYPKLLAAIPFTPATGPRFLISPNIDAANARRSLALLAAQIAEEAGLSSLHFNFLRSADAEALAELGFLIRHDQQFHWQNDGYRNFDEFLAALASRKRKQIRKERRTVAESDIEIRNLSGAEITEAHWDAFFDFYLDTGARKWGQPYLNREFFSLLGERMADRLLLILCQRGGRPVAGALNLIGADTLYGRYWGCIEEHPCLHFEVCYYRAIDYAIEHGLACVEAGAQGAHKLARGYSPVRTTSAHWICNPGFRDAVAHYLDQERAAVAEEIEYLGTRTPFKAQE